MEVVKEAQKLENGICECGNEGEVYKLTMESGEEKVQCWPCMAERVNTGKMRFIF